MLGPSHRPERGIFNEYIAAALGLVIGLVVGSVILNVTGWDFRHFVVSRTHIFAEKPSSD